jgi:hypothetical protein
MLAGCTTFLLVALFVYAVLVAPWFFVSGLWQLTAVGTACAYGLVPALLIGGGVGIKFGPAAALGFFGGVLASAVFLLIRIDQFFSLALARQAPEPDYPPIYRFLIPIVYVLVASFLVIMVWPKNPK